MSRVTPIRSYETSSAASSELRAVSHLRSLGRHRINACDVLVPANDLTHTRTTSRVACFG